MKKQIIIALATLTALPAVSQEKWDLRKCIDYAIEHNLSIKQQEAARDQNAVDLNTAKYSRLPNLNGNVASHLTSAVPCRQTIRTATVIPKTPTSHSVPVFLYLQDCGYRTTSLSAN